MKPQIRDMRNTKAFRQGKESKTNNQNGKTNISKNLKERFKLYSLPKNRDIGQRI